MALKQGDWVTLRGDYWSDVEGFDRRGDSVQVVGFYISGEPVIRLDRNFETWVDVEDTTHDRFAQLDSYKNSQGPDLSFPRKGGSYLPMGIETLRSEGDLYKLQSEWQEAWHAGYKEGRHDGALFGELKGGK